jgi:hypothetical protein
MQNVPQLYQVTAGVQGENRTKTHFKKQGVGRQHSETLEYLTTMNKKRSDS